MSEHKWGNGSLYGWAEQPPEPEVEIQRILHSFFCPACPYRIAHEDPRLVESFARQHYIEQHGQQRPAPTTTPARIAAPAERPQRIQLHKNPITGDYE
jgi:hypothetical protein